MYKDSLWNLFLMTGDVEYYLEFKKNKDLESFSEEENKNMEFTYDQNNFLR
ncbi:hypothetical protein [Maledivibacter halophilus]|uniref:YqzL-like protein n=1 Tax=Maledivibacter halophilus TaxID=36842 RepID=A0A1T5LUB6_9FIRM|nr:hypothetical protein [Maledivibacter halophilus]SKC79543.1 hypothetical protein SAMN02194393_03321 [Maledivibacter halophilus]